MNIGPPYLFTFPSIDSMIEFFKQSTISLPYGFNDKKEPQGSVTQKFEFKVPEEYDTSNTAMRPDDNEAEVDIDETGETFKASSSNEDSEGKPENKFLSMKLEGKKSSLLLTAMGNRSYNGLSVLYSRRVVLRLLASWPSSMAFDTKTVGSEDTFRNLLCILSLQPPLSPADSQGVLSRQKGVRKGRISALDLLQPALEDVLNRDDEPSEKLNDFLLRYAIMNLLVPVAKGGSQKLKFESKHEYDNNMNYKKKIYIPGATQIRITFDPQTRTESGCDYVEFAHDEAFGRIICRYSGGNSNFKDFTHNGDTLYYRFYSDGSVTYWGYLFYATGNQSLSSFHFCLTFIL